MLRSIVVLQSATRISSVDVFRAFAILAVVFYHFNGILPYGYLGVDLFFVISGLLVGSILIRKFRKNERISFWRFILQRGFKIWPSYYWFLLFGTVVAILFYTNIDAYYIINPNLKDIARYVFFYQNYTAGPSHVPFDHIWSLCIEEHFYILLPLLIIVTKAIFSNNLKMLFLAVAGLILAGIVFKILSLYFTSSKDTYMGTHSKLDSMGWGVLLGILVTYYEHYLERSRKLVYLFLTGFLLFSAGLFLFIYWDNYYYQKVGFFSLAPFCFSLMLIGLYYQDFSKWKPFRFIAYYSYNWYLWHPMFVLFISRLLGVNFWSFIIYLIVSFATAILFTILVEERFLKIREKQLSKWF